ncbi:hypothetical protein P3T43_001776 [Paraburkholderia sp. GAS41]|uniref:hypothetical protein n=1 Tax=Paraburkholderia sp. GAS41 TaxID=3035134 RepID=UPI003D195B70
MSIELDEGSRVLLCEIAEQHGEHVAERALYRMCLRDPELERGGVDSFYRQNPADEPEETQHIASDLGVAYEANHTWMSNAIRTTLGGFDWTPADLTPAWRAFVEGLVLADERSQQKALLAVLESSPENEPFLEDLFAICEAINDARPFALKHQRNGRWPDPAKQAGDPLSPVELALDLKLKTNDLEPTQ